MDDPARRRLWRRHWQQVAAWLDEHARRGYPRPAEDPGFYARCPPFPEALHDLTCGARTRQGTPCKRRDLGHGARYKLHGGWSTGPTTPPGKARVARNGRQPTRRKHG